MDLLLTYDVFEKSLNVLHDYQNMASIHESVGINETLCIIGKNFNLFSKADFQSAVNGTVADQEK